MKPKIFIELLRENYNIMVIDGEMEIERGETAIADGGTIDECEVYVGDIVMGVLE